MHSYKVVNKFMCLTEKYTIKMMVSIRQICILYVYIQFHVCDADVTIHVSAMINRTSTDQDLSIHIYYVVSAAWEINGATCEWQLTARMPSFEYYYTHAYVPGSGGTTITNSDIEWNPMRTPEELKDASGEVLCTALLDDQPKAYQAFILNIHSKPGTASTLRNPASGDIIRDTTLIMTCSGDKGNPPGSVTWKINGTEMTDDMYTTDEITINAAQAEHDGDWTCYFTNGIGSGNKSEIQPVKVKWKPGPCSLILNTDDDYIILGSELILACTCADKGKPTGEINWSLNGNKNYGSMYQTDVITIDSVETQHAGEWKCYYINAIGFGTSSMKTIDIKWPPGRSLLLVDTQFPKLHDSFTLTCSGDQGNPKERVAWYLDSLFFTNTTDITLNISSAAQEHNGDWSCMFSNYLDDGGISNSVRVQVLCVPSLYVEYVSYAFNESYVHFNLRLNDESAADTVNVQVCSTPNDEPLCSTASSKLENKELITDVELPEPSDHTLYNVTFIFSHGSRIVSRHGIALRGIALRDVNPPKEKEAEVHYVNVGAETGADTVTYKTSATDYEDVARDAAPISAHSTENTTYMDLDQTDISQTRNRPADLTVYQSLH